MCGFKRNGGCCGATRAKHCAICRRERASACVSRMSCPKRIVWEGGPADKYRASSQSPLSAKLSRRLRFANRNHATENSPMAPSESTTMKNSRAIWGTSRPGLVSAGVVRSSCLMVSLTAKARSWEKISSGRIWVNSGIAAMTRGLARSGAVM